MAVETKVKGSSISFYTSGSRPAQRLVSGTTVCEEALDSGRLIGLYWSAAGQVQRENAAAGLPGLDSLRRPLHAFELEIDGQSLHNHWDWHGGTTRPGSRPGTVEAVIELCHQVRPVTVRVVTRLDGTPVLTRRLEITNTGAEPAALAAVAPWSGVLWNTDSETRRRFTNANPSLDPTAARYVLGYLRNEEALEEGDFVWQPLPLEHFRIERTTHGKPYNPPYYIVRNEATGEIFFMALAWSSNFFTEFAQWREGLLTFRTGPIAPAPLRVIAPGETVESPAVHLAPMHGSLDDAVAQWHRHLRASVIPPRPADKRMFTIGGRVVEEPGEWILREIDIAAEMGVEAFMVDAGWYGSAFGSWTDLRGDWVEGDWLPGGLAGVRDYAHRKGLLFGLWHEPETVTDKSALRRAHPDWLLTTDDGRQVSDALNLANPAAASFFEETVVGLVRDHKLDFLKLDYNIGVGEGGQSRSGALAENEQWRHCEVVYRTYERVLREFPDVCLENCASGGGRNDLGMLSRFHYAAQSDWSVLPYSIRSINAMTLFLPPEALCYYHNHVNWMNVQAHQRGGLDTHLRVSLFAVPIFVGFGGQNADRSTEFFDATRRCIELHKGFCRPVLAGGAIVYHHTPDIGIFNPAEWCVLEYAAADLSRGYAGVFRLAPGRGEYLLRLRGVEMNSDYEVTLDNRRQVFRVSGQQLALDGLRVALDSALTSELVLYERVKREG